jgi:hypothetical protein
MREEPEGEDFLPEEGRSWPDLRQGESFLGLVPYLNTNQAINPPTGKS